MNTCAICQRNRSTFSINVPVDDEPEIFDIEHVCGPCCDIIATIAARPLLVEIESRLSRLEVFTGMTAPVPSLPVARIAAQQASDAKFDAALAMRARDDHDEMATWLTEQIGESVQHHPIENLRIFMERQIHNLEAGL